MEEDIASLSSLGDPSIHILGNQDESDAEISEKQENMIDKHPPKTKKSGKTVVFVENTIEIISKSDTDDYDVLTSAEEANDGMVREREEREEDEMGRSDKRTSSEMRENEFRGGPDGGWGWIVLTGSFMIMLLTSFIGPCFSLVFSPLLHDMDTSPSVISWIFNTFCLIWNMIGPVVSPLTEEFSYRCVTMTGAFLVVVGLISSAFATSAWSLFCFFSLIAGLGSGVLVTVSQLIIPVYFHKRLGRANGILMAGPSVGLFIAPHLITYLQEHYAYLGTTLILGGIFLNTCVSAIVFHPVKWHLQKPIHNGYCSCAKKDILGNTVDVEHMSTECQAHIMEKHIDCQGYTHRESSRVLTETRTSVKWFELGHLLFRVCKKSVLSLKILASPAPLIIALTSTLTVNCYLNFLLIVPFVSNARASVHVTALCFSVAGICNLICRLLVSALTDFRWFNMKFVYIIGVTLMGATTLAFLYLTSSTWMLVVMGVWGCGLGTFMGLYILVMIKYVGKEKFPSLFGATSLLNGLGFILIGPLLGWITQLTSSYKASIWILSAVEGLCAVLWLFMPELDMANNKSSSSKVP